MDKQTAPDSSQPPAQQQNQPIVAQPTATVTNAPIVGQPVPEEKPSQIPWMQSQTSVPNPQPTSSGNQSEVNQIQPTIAGQNVSENVTASSVFPNQQTFPVQPPLTSSLSSAASFAVQSPANSAPLDSSQKPEPLVASVVPPPQATQGIQSPPPPPKTSSKNLLMLGIVAGIAVILGGFVAYNALQNSRSHVAAMSTSHPATARVIVSVSPTPASTAPAINPKDTSDIGLQHDAQTINGEVNQLNTDLQNTDQSLSDQPVNLNQ